MTQWISTKVAMPAVDPKTKLSDFVLVLTKENMMKISQLQIWMDGKIYWTNGYRRNDQFYTEYDSISHWMPLPSNEGLEK